MKILLTVLVGICMLATLGTLFAGMLGLTRSDHNPAWSNRLMRWRVILQGVTIGLFLLLLMVSRH